MFVASVVKELQLLRRDPRAVLRLLVLPLAFMTLFGHVFSTAGKPATARPVLVWRAAGEPSARLVAALEASTLYRVVPASSADAVRRGVAAEDYDFGLVLEAEFDPLHGHPGELVIDLAGSSPQTGPLIGALTAFATRSVVGGSEPPVVLVPTSPPGIKPGVAGMSAFQVTVPGNAVLFGFFIALTCALSFAEERRTGTGRRLLAAPVVRWKLLGAKLLPYIVLGTLQVGTLFAIGALVYGMQIGGSVLGVVVLTIGVASCAASLGLLIASVSSTEKQISSLGSLLVLIMGLLGGAVFPRALMPHALQQAGLFVPHGWALDGYYTLLVRSGSTIVDVAPQIGAVFGFALVFAAIGVWRFKFEG